MRHLLLLVLSTAVLVNALPAQANDANIVNFMTDATVRTGGTIRKDGSVAQEWKPFVAFPGENFQDRAGFHSVVSGDSSTVAVGSPLASTENGEKSGSVSVYKREGVMWARMGDPIPGDTAREQAGYAIALNFAGDAVAIGSPYYNRTNKDANYDQSVPYVGQVRVFHFMDGSWVQLGRPMRGTQSGAKCGFSVHMGAMGRNLVVGCPLAKDYAHVRPNSGMVKVMKYDEKDAKWVTKGKAIYGNTTNILAGIRVSMSGDANTMAFIAPGISQKDTSPGRVRVFTYEGSEWEQKGEPIVNYDENDKRGRGMMMSRDGLNVAIGSPSKLKHKSGHVRVYHWNDAAWVQKGEAVPGGGSYHTVGTCVALNTDASVLAVGAPFNSAKGKTAGRVRVYQWKTDRTKGGVNLPQWVLKGQKLDGDEGDTFGFSVHLSGKGNMLVVGAPQYKWKKDKDPVFINAAAEAPLDYDDEEDDEDDDEDDEDEEIDEEDIVANDAMDASSRLVANDHKKRVALAGESSVRTSWHGPNYDKFIGNGRARVLGAFECHFKGDLQPPSNPYAMDTETEQ